MSIEMLEEVRRMGDPPKDTPLGFRIPSEVKQALEKAAKAEDRSVSNLVLRILIEWLKRRKYLGKDY